MEEYSYEKFIEEHSKQEVFDLLNQFFGLREDGKEEEFLKWYYGE